MQLLVTKLAFDQNDERCTTIEINGHQLCMQQTSVCQVCLWLINSWTMLTFFLMTGTPAYTTSPFIIYCSVYQSIQIVTQIKWPDKDNHENPCLVLVKQEIPIKSKTKTN
jgi:hypothetical protein